MASIFSFIAFSLSLLLLTKLLLSLSSSKKKKNLPPSPLSLPIIGHLYLFKKPLHRTLSLLSARHGPILLLRFGSRPVLVVSSPSLAEECFTKNDLAFANRPHLPTGKHLSFNYNALGSANYGPHWRNMRRIATIEVLSSHRLQSFSDLRTGEVKAMLRRLFKESVGTEESTRVELKSRLFGMALNIMMLMIAGKRYYGEEVADSEEAKRFEEAVEAAFSLAGASNLRDFLPFLRWVDFQGVKGKLVRLEKYRNEFLQGLIDEKRRESEEEEGVKEEDKKKKKTMIDVLLELQKTDPDYYTDDIIKALIIVS